MLLALVPAGDLVFVVPEAWFVTPIFYYLDDHGQTYVASDYRAAGDRNPGARVWLLFHGGEDRCPGRIPAPGRI